MTMFLAVDTETTGMPTFGRDNPADGPGQPHIVQLAAHLLDGTLQPLRSYCSIVQPTADWNMAPEALAVHGISIERAKVEGRPIAEVMGQFNLLFAASRTLMGFHLRFDLKLVRGELRRLGMPDQYGQRREFDVCQAARKPCALPKSKGPKLEEACRILLGRELEGAHDANADCLATIDVARVLRDQHGVDIRGAWPKNFEWKSEKEGTW